MKYLKLFEQIISEREYPEYGYNLTLREKSVFNGIFGEDYLNWAFGRKPEIKKDDGYYYVKYSKDYPPKFEMFNGFGELLTWMVLQGVIKLNSPDVFNPNKENKLLDILSSNQLLDPSLFDKILEVSLEVNSYFVKCLWHNPKFDRIKNLNKLLMWAVRYENIDFIKEILKYSKADLDIKSAIELCLSKKDGASFRRETWGLSTIEIIRVLLDDKRAKKVYKKREIEYLKKYLDDESNKMYKVVYATY